AKAVASLESGECPYDGLPIDWGRFLPAIVLPELGGRELGAGYWELPYVRPPPYHLDLSKLKLLRGKYGELAKTIGGSYLPRQVAESRWTEFETQHKRRATWLRELEAIKSQAGSELAEVDSLVKNGPGIIMGPGFSYPGDKTVRKPNC
ncbi:unnamed protein product, partial [marine sediment metagenome]